MLSQNSKTVSRVTSCNPTQPPEVAYIVDLPFGGIQNLNRGFKSLNKGIKKNSKVNGQKNNGKPKIENCCLGFAHAGHTE